MAGLAAGSLTHLVQLEQVTSRTADGDGGYTDVYEALDPPEAYVAIAPVGAQRAERVVGQAIEASVSHLITMYYEDGTEVNTQTRLRYGTRIFLVHGVENVDEANVRLVLSCSEIVA